MNLNWVDLVILSVVVFFIADGWETGLVYLLSHSFAFLGSLLFAIRYHTIVGTFISEKFGTPPIWTDVTGYLIVSVICETIFAQTFAFFIRKLPKQIFASHYNHTFGAVLSALNSLVITSFLLLLILLLPLRGTVKNDIKSSSIGSRLVLLAEKYGGSIKSSFEEIAQETTKFMTIKPQSSDRIYLPIAPKAESLQTDPDAQAQMVLLVNNERKKKNLSQLSVDIAMTDVAAQHSRDMFIRQYFSHYDLEGHDASYRMSQSNISYTMLGENLAYGPDVMTAHTGLMESEEHRDNILDTRYHRIGIGIVKSTTFGMMFTQLFAD